MALGGLQASRDLHVLFIQGILHAPLLFYDLTPLGRVLNRSADDMLTIDLVMHFTVRSMINGVIQTISTIGVIVVTTPVFIVVVPPLAVFYHFMQVLISHHCVDAWHGMTAQHLSSYSSPGLKKKRLFFLSWFGFLNLVKDIFIYYIKTEYIKNKFKKNWIS